MKEIVLVSVIMAVVRPGYAAMQDGNAEDDDDHSALRACYEGCPFVGLSPGFAQLLFGLRDGGEVCSKLCNMQPEPLPDLNEPLILDAASFAGIRLGEPLSDLTRRGFAIHWGESYPMIGRWKHLELTEDGKGKIRSVRVALAKHGPGVRYGGTVIPASASLAQVRAYLPGCDADQVSIGATLVRCDHNILLIASGPPGLVAVELATR